VGCVGSALDGEGVFETARTKNLRNPVALTPSINAADDLFLFLGRICLDAGFDRNFINRLVDMLRSVFLGIGTHDGREMNPVISRKEMNPVI
jgi:hypothetical protein